MSPRRQVGATLIELVVALVLAGILAAVAVASYRGQLLRANRSEARAALLSLAAAQETFHLRCQGYATTLRPEASADCEARALPLGAASEGGHYSIAIASADANGWAARAVANGPLQLADRRCRAFELSGTGARSATDAAGRDSSLECWGR